MAMNGQLNGGTGKYLDSLDTDDPEYVRQLMRPVDVKEDVRQMEERKRVKLVLESSLFRNELEELVVEQLFQNGGPLTPNSVTAKNLSDLLANRVKNAAIKNGLGPCIPISDIKSSVVVDPLERTFRCKLASLYRIIDLMGWSRFMQGGISGRISQEHERFLMGPYGIFPNEVTTTNLLKVNTKGDVLDTPVNPLIHNFYNGETTNLTNGNQAGVDKNEFKLHSAIYVARPDARCIVHLANSAAVSISALNQGLLPLSKEAICLGDCSYYVYNGGTLDPEQRDKLRRSLGPSNKVLFLRNFGAMLIGTSVEEAFWLTRHLMSAVNEQVSVRTRARACVCVYILLHFTFISALIGQNSWGSEQSEATIG
ncbi:hypothetical protein HELRODRAFT_115400 [Helobdella robusta]|uniref:Class II aldolase/adducin N-terminal domain-containing protein n=1 Tax=Helobdella robusta TaxID=6412 RepID=T1EG79_HELRO|nr:hypothetical protein HELRODRAFT_115400 [Helobdella robusta]ESN93722.1 hypothetical protein HELRODRAFT_115400 [Helobdella robusta]